MNGLFASLGGTTDVPVAKGLPGTDWSFVNAVSSVCSFYELGWLWPVWVIPWYGFICVPLKKVSKS